jgi:hypothetical protein
MTRITIFLMFVSVTLITNALVIWLIYRLFADATTKVTKTLLEFGPGGSSREVIEFLESASAQAVIVTDELREQLALSEPALAEAHSRLGYGLAKVDVRFERFCDRVGAEAEKAQAAILRPTEKIGAVASGVKEVIGLFIETAPDATSTPKR